MNIIANFPNFQDRNFNESLKTEVNLLLTSIHFFLNVSGKILRLQMIVFQSNLFPYKNKNNIMIMFFH